MNYDNASSLKSELSGTNLWAGIKQPSGTAFAAGRSRAIAADDSRLRRNPAIGISGKGKNFHIAVRIQDASTPGIDEVVERIRSKAKAEVDIRVVDRVFAQRWHRKKNRPLRIGGSVGHFSITAGTLGCFVTRYGEDRILSNNHVLANENAGSIGDNIIQPGDLDGGKNPRDKVATLDKFIKLKAKNNLVDAATATLVEGIEYYYNWVEGRGEIKGVRTGLLEDGETVYKLGRTTGLTKGKVSAIELDNLEVGFDMGVLSFDNQFEIEPADGEPPFSKGGDSGSLILDSKMKAVGLLFAGNDFDATFANPIGTVLDKLGVELVF